MKANILCNICKFQEKFGDQFEEQKSETMNWTGWHDLVCKGIMAVSSAVSVR